MSSEENSKHTKSYEIPLLPLRDIIVFPSTVVPLFVGREKSIIALERAMSGNKEIMLAAQKKAKTNDPNEEDIFLVGTVSNILQMLRLPDGTVKVLVEGQKRAIIKNFIDSDEHFLVQAEDLIEEKSESLENEALIRTVKLTFDNYVRLNKRTPPEILLSINQIDDESKLSDTLVSHLGSLKLKDKQKLLEEVNPRKRLEDLYGFIQSEIEIIRVEKKIKARVKRQMEKTQKEYYLNEQMAAIQKELGEKDDGRAEIQEMERLLKEKVLSTEAREKVTKELKKLKSMSSMSAEATVVRNYLDTVLSLPWGEYTNDKDDVVHAEEILNRDHFGLDKVKDRILEYLSIKSLTKQPKGPILCLVGPPGVGKTSLAKSIAESLGRKYVRMALGGVRDHAEIRGHRRTYIGAMPGKIMLAIKKAGSSNPLILLDEIDKLSADQRGDPAAALLEVLDPEQNSKFNDHYIDLDYDLSKCLFIATANTLDTIPGPLLDRMEIIRIAGYTEWEKVQIAEKYLIPKQILENGLEKQEITFNQKAVLELIRHYTREAGVRSLEREISSLLRKVARRHIKKQTLEKAANALKLGEAAKTLPKEKPSELAKISEIEKSLQSSAAPSLEKSVEKISTVTPAGDVVFVRENIKSTSISRYLGQPKYRHGKQNPQPEIGICTGLAWTPVGGELLMTEVAVLPGKGKLTITGKLGDVMQESAQAALSYVRSRSEFLGIDEAFYQKIDIHIHVPEGAIPKDGPSAGLCMATALTSALTGRPISQNVAMTGEITLRGRSLPIGGLKEKALAAHRGGIKKVLFPKENLKDLEDIPKSIQKDMEFIPVEHMDEVLIHALVWEKNSDKKKDDDLLIRLTKATERSLKDYPITFTH